MVHGIASLVQGEGPHPRGALRASLAYVLGGVIGGALTVGTLWLLAVPVRTLLPSRVVDSIAIVVLVLAVLQDLGRLRLPHRRTQVPQRWLQQLGPGRAYYRYGLLLGSGLLTAAPYGITFAIMTAAALRLEAGDALVVGALFGLGRTATIGFATPLSAVGFAANAWLARAYRVLPKVSLVMTLTIGAGLVRWR